MYTYIYTNVMYFISQFWKEIKLWRKWRAQLMQSQWKLVEIQDETFIPVQKCSQITENCSERNTILVVYIFSSLSFGPVESFNMFHAFMSNTIQLSHKLIFSFIFMRGKQETEMVLDYMEGNIYGKYTSFQHHSHHNTVMPWHTIAYIHKHKPQPFE